MCFPKKCQTSSFESGGPSSFIFRSEKRYQPFIFLAKLTAEHVFSDRNPKDLKQFQSKEEGPDAMRLSGLGQPHEFANPLAFKPLSRRHPLTNTPQPSPTQPSPAQQSKPCKPYSCSFRETPQRIGAVLSDNIRLSPPRKTALRRNPGFCYVNGCRFVGFRLENTCRAGIFCKETNGSTTFF